MPRPRHRAAPRRMPPAAVSRWAVVAALLTGTVATVLAVTGASSTEVDLTPRADVAVARVDLDRLVESRQQRVSRTADRVRLEPRPVARKYATAGLNLWPQPRERGRRLGLVEAGTRLAVTGQVEAGWAEVLVKGEPRWVNAEYLSSRKPATGGAAVSGISGAPCPDGSAIEGGLSSAADQVYRAVCAAFPQPTSYGGYDGHGEHVDGRAIDIMISGSLGWQIAEWLRAHAATLHVRDVIYSQHIWTPERSGEGWRSMSDRGSATANHYDHVHVAVY